MFCLTQLQTLRKMIEEQVEKDPNLSLLLGTREEQPDPEEESKSLIEILQIIKEEIGNLQRLITTKYAEYIGNECGIQ